MDEYKFKPLEDWLGRVREADCDSFFVMAINNKNKFVASCKCNIDTLANMLFSAARQDKEIAQTIVAVASIIVKEAEQGCHNCQHAGLLGGNEKDPVAVAHCAIHKETHRLPHSCDDWKQREEKGEQQ